MPNTSNILIVDGNVRMCDSLIALLKDYDYRLSKSHSVDDAIEQLEQGNFDLVILDLFAPNRDGFRIIEHLNGKCPDCLAIIISGYATVESAVEALKKGVYDYIRKPFEPEEFITTVKNAIDHKKLQSERKQARQALRKSQRELAIRNRISQIFLTMTDGESYPEVLQVVLEALGKRNRTALGYGRHGSPDLSERIPGRPRSARRFQKGFEPSSRFEQRSHRPRPDQQEKPGFQRLHVASGRTICP